MREILEQVQWDDLYRFLTDGYPSLLMQLAIINGLAIIVMLAKRFRQSSNLRYRRNYFILEFFMVANMVVLSEDRYMPFVNKHIAPVIWEFRHHVL